ncbi:MAG: autotransporter assembly complex family protein [Pseudomonadota bacterium]
MPRISTTTAIALLFLSNSAYADTPDIVVDGVTGVLRDNVLSHLSMTTAGCDAPGWRIERLFKRADGEIRRALRALGYYHAAVQKDMTRTEHCWHVHFLVDPGPQVTLGKVDIKILGEAADDPAFEKARKLLPLKKGKPLNHGLYEQTKQSIASLASERGYFDSRFTVHELRVDRDTNRAVIRLHFDSGSRYKFGRVDIDQDILAPSFVARYVRIKEGSPYTTRKLTALNQDLTNSGYFTGVDVRPRIRKAKHLKVPIDVKLTPRKKHRYSFGVGFDTDTGPRVSGGYENRRLTRSGHRFDANLRISPVLSKLTAEYKIPLRNPTREYLILQTGFKREETASINSNSYLVGLRSLLLHESGWLVTPSLNLSREDFVIGNDNGTASLLVPGVGGSHTRADGRLRIENGYRVNFELQGAHDSLISDVSFIQFKAYGKLIKSLPWGGRFISRGEFGAMAVDEFSSLPATYRFFAGGDQSVRGYGYKELGPKDSDGDNLGGHYLTVLSVEYEQPVIENWSVAGFIDSGNATDSLNFDLKTGVGFGVRWQSFLGPIRLDIAFPIDESDDTFRIHFAMGPEL